jgi:hypothetical protein
MFDGKISDLPNGRLLEATDEDEDQGINSFFQ